MTCILVMEILRSVNEASEPASSLILCAIYGCGRVGDAVEGYSILQVVWLTSCGKDKRSGRVGARLTYMLRKGLCLGTS
jgi:hypothetical protein